MYGTLFPIFMTNWFEWEPHLTKTRRDVTFGLFSVIKKSNAARSVSRMVDLQYKNFLYFM